MEVAVLIMIVISVLLFITLAVEGYFHNYIIYRKRDSKTIPFHGKLNKERPNTLDSVKAICLDNRRKKRMLCQTIVATNGGEFLEALISYLWWNYYGNVINDYEPVADFIRKKSIKQEGHLRVIIPLVHVQELSPDWYKHEWHYYPRFKSYFRCIPQYQPYIDSLRKRGIMTSDNNNVATPELKQILIKIDELLSIAGPSSIYRNQVNSLHNSVTTAIYSIDKMIQELQKQHPNQYISELLKLRENNLGLNEEIKNLTYKLRTIEKEFEEERTMMRKEAKNRIEEMMHKAIAEKKVALEKEHHINEKRLSQKEIEIEKLRDIIATIQKEKDIQNAENEFFKKEQMQKEKEIEKLQCIIAEKERFHQGFSTDALVSEPILTFASHCNALFNTIHQLEKEAHSLCERVVGDSSVRNEDKDDFNYYYVRILTKFNCNFDYNKLRTYESTFEYIANTGRILKNNTLWDFLSKQEDNNIIALSKWMYQELLHDLCGSAIIFADDMASLSVFCPSLGFDSKQFEQISSQLLILTREMGFEPVYVKLFTPYTNYLNVRVDKSIMMTGFNKNDIMEVLHMGVNYQNTSDMTHVTINE